jgi:hypothetical protein
MDFLEISEYNKSILIGLYLNRADDRKYVMLKDVDPNNKPKGLRKLETDKLILSGLIEYRDTDGGLARITNTGVQYVESYLLHNKEEAENPVRE